MGFTKEAQQRGLAAMQAKRAAVKAQKEADAAKGKPSLDEQMVAGRTAQVAARVVVDGEAEFGQDFAAAHQSGLEGVYVTSTEPDQYVVYDDWGIARRIRRDTYGEVRRAVTADGRQLHPECPLCGKLHPESEVNPNACKVRQSMEGKQCPECGKVIWGEMPAQFAKTSHPDPHVKQVDISTEALERMADRNFRMHVGTYHPSLADTLNIAVNPLAGNVSTIAGRAA